MNQLLNTFFLTTILFIISSTTFASVMIKVGDEKTRHHLQVLADNNIIHLSLFTWPMMWSTVSSMLEGIEPNELNHRQAWSYRYLAHKLKTVKNDTTQHQRIYASSTLFPHHSFSSNFREKAAIQNTLSITTNNLAFELDTQRTEDPLDTSRNRLDGSFVAYAFDDWVVGLGAINRWWGSGWQNTAVLSHNARPSPGLFIQRSHNTPSKHTALAWMGRWHTELFINRLTSNDMTEKQYFSGIQFSIQPIKSLSIAIEKTAIIQAPNNQSNDSSPAQNVISPTNNNTLDNITDFLIGDESNNAINGVFALDWKYSKTFKSLDIGLYQQLSNQTSKYQISDNNKVIISGIETSFMFNHIQHRFVLEYANRNSNIQPLDNEQPNSPLQPLYMFRDRSFNSLNFNTRKTMSLKGLHYFEDGKEIGWHIERRRYSDNTELTLNNTSQPTDASISRVSAITSAKLFYKKPASEKLKIELGLHYQNKPTLFQGESFKTGIYGIMHFAL